MTDREQKILEIKMWSEGKIPLPPDKIGKCVSLLISELELKEAELQSTIQLGLKYQEENRKLIEGLREVFKMQKSLHTASKTSLHVQTLLKAIGVEV